MNKRKMKVIFEVIIIFVIGLLVYALDGIRMSTPYTYFFGELVQRSFIFDSVMIIIFILLVVLIILVLL